MPIKVQKIAEVLDSEIVVYGKRPGQFVAILTNREPPETDPGPSWSLPLVIGEGKIRLDIAPLLTEMEYRESFDKPTVLWLDLHDREYLIFQNCFFLTDRKVVGKFDREEVELRIRRVVYAEKAELTALKSAVANMEATIAFEKSGPRRDPIPDDVKLLVWSRDGGACVRCGSRENLHFDHIIPVTKGGGKTAANIQVLCETCNLRKSDKIAF
ncbi:MAG TPA: HNH endonuclease [Caulobacteraceae bacterium]|jgi:hypothetical protein